MCIISVKPQGLSMPSMDTIAECWSTNSDGAGFAYWRPGLSNVVIDKGYMKLKVLKARLRELDFGMDDLVVLHFRFATHGAVDRGNCHPFPLSRKIEALRAISGDFPCAVAHNGVFGAMDSHETLSDTQKFVRGILASPAVIDNLENPAIKELISGYCGSSSKLAILKPGKLLLIGNFVKDDATGLMYSNYQYKKYNYTPRADDNGEWAAGTWIKCSAHSVYGCLKCEKVERLEKLDKRYELETVETRWDGKCELCNSDNKVEYEEDFQLFLCEKCLEFNTSVIYPASETRAPTGTGATGATEKGDRCAC